MKYLRYRLGVCSVAMGVLCLTLPVQAEMYVAGQVGANFPDVARNGELSGGGMTLGLDNLKLQKSLMYGAKLGYYFNSLKWLGVETEVFNSTPHVKQQEVTTTGAGIPVGTATQAGLNNRVLTWAPLVVVIRYQAGAFEPYAGVGLGVFFSRISDGTGSSSSTDVGLNTQLGMRYRVTNNLALFGEWKFNHANISHSNFLGVNGVDFSASYNANILAFGAGYHF